MITIKAVAVGVALYHVGYVISTLALDIMYRNIPALHAVCTTAC